MKNAQKQKSHCFSPNSSHLGNVSTGGESMVRGTLQELAAGLPEIRADQIAHRQLRKVNIAL
jgi:hypothetical protein